MNTSLDSSRLSRRDFLQRAAMVGAAAAAASSMSSAQTAATATPVPQRPPSPRPIPTATGSILPQEMGITSLHEHIALRQPGTEDEVGFAWAVRELKEARALGLRTIVDVGPADNVSGIREVSRASGVNVVCCTGFYLLSPAQAGLRVEDFENLMIRDMEEGLSGTGIRPGVIKVRANGLPIREVEDRLFTAAAKVQRRYNLPLCAHSVAGCVEQQRILEAGGADLTKCYFSHIEATFGWQKRTVAQQVDYLEQVVAKGSTLSFNNFGNWNHTKPEDLAHLIRELTARGYDDRMVATMDVTWKKVDGKVELLWAPENKGGEDRTFSYLLRKVVPWMEENGIPPGAIHRMILENPRRIFTASA